MNPPEQRPTTAAGPAAELPHARTVTLLPHAGEQPRFQQTWRVFGLFDSNDLAIEVEDAFPDFPRFEEFSNQSGEARGTPTGLWWVALYRGRLSYDVTKDDEGVVVGKTVQALIPPTWDGSA
ncbi:hypothetical protein AB0D33_26570 [Streptomyces sp. NPDC048404]|uniref:hypothetical protein n=1 Tax=unclassified Streptomyces TaxID=2593676 RepID=UPI003414A988